MSLQFPALKNAKTASGGVTSFAGLNHNLRIQDNQFYDMVNASSALLPVMSSRPRRRKLRTLNSPNGLFAHEKLCWVNGGSFFYDGVKKGSVTDGPKQFVRMGAYVLIWPDKAYYNTHTDEFGLLSGQYTSTGKVTAALCRIDGQLYGSHTTGDTPPAKPAGGDLWMDTSDSPAVLRQYVEATGMWQAIPTVYTRIEATGIGKAFAQHDGVFLSGFTDESLNGNFYLVNAGDNYLVVVAMITAALSQTAKVTVERRIPDMDFLVEHDNRVWGCSSQNHEIYASALGDPKNWNQYMGLASDSYAVTVGSTGPFTGAASHMGMIFFFKEECIHQMMGTRPSNFQLDTTNCRGVAAGSEKSLCRVNETLYYLSAQDVCAFAASLPSGISGPLGTERLTDGIAGVLDDRYYLSAKDGNGSCHLYVYDTKLGVWVREDDTRVLAFASLDHELYMLDEAGVLWSVMGGEAYGDETSQLEGDVEWMLETGDIGYETQRNQYVSAIQLHGECAAHGSMQVLIRYGTDGEWKQVYATSPEVRRSLVVPILPRRERLIRLRITGTGEFRLYSLTMRIRKGSAVYDAK